MIKKIPKLAFSNIERLSKKDSNISTKRYADLRIINHFIFQSWVILSVFIYARAWEELRYHVIILGSFAFLRGVLALDSLKNIFSKNDKSNSDNT